MVVGIFRLRYHDGTKHEMEGTGIGIEKMNHQWVLRHHNINLL